MAELNVCGSDRYFGVYATGGVGTTITKGSYYQAGAGLYLLKFLKAGVLVQNGFVGSHTPVITWQAGLAFPFYDDIGYEVLPVE